MPNWSRNSILASLLFLFLINALTSCTKDLSNTLTTQWVHHDEWSLQVHRPNWPDVATRGIGVGFLRPEERAVHPYERKSTDFFEIAADKPFTTDLILLSGFEEPYPVLVSLFVDYQQTSFLLDGVDGLLHYFVINPNEELEIPLAVNITDEGWHDLFVVVFLGPESHPTDPDARLPGSPPPLGERRTVVCVDNCSLHQTLPQPISGRDINATRSPIDAFSLLPGDQPPKQRLFTIATAEPNAFFDIELWARNSGSTTLEYVVLPLLDFVQIPFTKNDVGVLHLALPPGNELILPGQILVPKTEGTHEFLFIIIFEPYRSLDAGIDPFVQSEMRSAIIVEP